jgi:hypothetical protein
MSRKAMRRALAMTMIAAALGSGSATTVARAQQFVHRLRPPPIGVGEYRLAQSQSDESSISGSRGVHILAPDDPVIEAQGQDGADRGIVVEPVGPGKSVAAPNLESASPAKPAASSARPNAPAGAPKPITLQSPIETVRIASLDGQANQFAGLSLQAPYEIVAPGANPDVVWDPAERDVRSSGDIIARNVGRNDLPSVIERTATIRWLKTRSSRAPQAIRILPANGLHHKGSMVEVEITGLAGRSLLLFNISGDGTVQMLYPMGSDPAVRSDGEYHLQLQVREPLGSDQIVVVSATTRLAELEQGLRLLDKKRNPMKVFELINRFATTDALVGSVSLLTAP